MLKEVKITAEPRDEKGSKKNKRLRIGGYVPAVIYGKGEQGTPLKLSHAEVHKLFKSKARIFDLNIGGKSTKVVVKAVQWNALRDRIIHLDFQKISLTDYLEFEIPLEVTGQAEGVLKENGVLQVYLHSVKVLCTPASIPEKFVVDISALKLNEKKKVKDITLPEGVKLNMSAEAVIAAVIPKVEEVPVAPTEGETAAPAEPEVIKKGKKEEEEAEGSAGAEKKPEAKK